MLIETWTMPAVRELHAHGLDVPEAAREVADRLRDAVGDREVPGREVDVVRDQEGPRAHGDGARRGMGLGRAEVRAPSAGPSSSRRSPRTVPCGPRRGCGGARRVAESSYRYTGTPNSLRDRGARLPRERDAVLDDGAPDRDEGNDVHRAHPGMLAPVAAQVDPREAASKSAATPAPHAPRRHPRRSGRCGCATRRRKRRAAARPATARTRRGNGVDRGPDPAPRRCSERTR